MKKAMATHSSALAWKIPWMEEPGRLQSMGLLRVRYDWMTSLSLFTFMHWRRKWHLLQCSCLENPRDRGAWWAAVYGVAQSQTRPRWLSSSSNSGLKCKERLTLCMYKLFIKQYVCIYVHTYLYIYIMCIHYYKYIIYKYIILYN